MTELEKFEFMIITSLFNVDQSYYTTTYYNIQSFREALQGRLGKIKGDNFVRYGERVWCYEFYHQLRILIDKERNLNLDYMKGAFFQGEVQKMQIEQLVEAIGLDNMDGEYSPDFLMHSPGHKNNHAFVIEVKCENDLTERKFKNDIKKINQFIESFNYKRGVFLAINAEPSRIERIIQNLNLNASVFNWREEYSMDDRLLIEFLPDLNDQKKISIICKEDQQSEPVIWKI